MSHRPSSVGDADPIQVATAARKEFVVNGNTSSTADAVEKTLPMGVANIGFMLERLGRDCDDLQFLRELTQNALQAGAKTIVWDADWTIWQATGGYKLCVVDDGCGMTAEEMLRYINHLSSSTHLQAHDGNFGVGAKVAAATRNPAGVIYQSWKDGKGAMIQLWRDPVTDEYGLRQFGLPNGQFNYWVPLDDKAKPKEISEHGTKVTLLGHEPDTDTMKAPEGVATPSRWVNRHLNGRYFRFPADVEVKAREGWEADPGDTKRNLLRTVRGQKSFLDQHSDESGIVELPEGRIHWWILSNTDSRRDVSEVVNTGHFASLYQDELYELRTGRSGVTRLHQFGIIFGHDRVVLYAEPLNGSARPLSANTARTQLLRNGLPLPYADWAVEFRANMPQEIKDHMDAVIAGTGSSSHRDSIAERLKSYARLFRLSRYRLRSDGTRTISDPIFPRRQPSQTPETMKESDNATPQRTRKPSDPIGPMLAALLADEGELGDRESSDEQDLPSVSWVSLEAGSRAPDFLADRAAVYIFEDNMIQANADFRVFTDMADYWCDEYGVERGNKAIVDVVHEWFEQALVETVVGCQALQGERLWSPDDIKKALSEESLTATVMQRYHVANSIKRTLGAKMGSLKERGAGSVATTP